MRTPDKIMSSFSGITTVRVISQETEEFLNYTEAEARCMIEIAQREAWNEALQLVGEKIPEYKSDILKLKI